MPDPRSRPDTNTAVRSPSRVSGERTLRPPLRWLGAEIRGFLKRGRDREHALFVERLADHLQAERQPLRVECGGQRKCWKAGEIGGHGENVVEIHRERIA